MEPLHLPKQIHFKEDELSSLQCFQHFPVLLPNHALTAETVKEEEENAL